MYRTCMEYFFFLDKFKDSYVFCMVAVVLNPYGPNINWPTTFRVELPIPYLMEFCLVVCRKNVSTAWYDSPISIHIRVL
jgi:hypothetical protein